MALKKKRIKNPQCRSVVRPVQNFFGSILILHTPPVQRVLAAEESQKAWSMTTLQDGFKQAFDNFKKRLKPEEEVKFAVTSLNDLELAVKDLQERQRKTKTAQNLKRIEPFLQAMEQYKEIIEVFLNASSLLCFIWGPMKFMLMVGKDSWL
jgi:hypothetical protein